MILPAHDLIRLGELILLAAQTARALCSRSVNGGEAEVMDAADRLEIAANDLIEAGRKMQSKNDGAS